MKSDDKLGGVGFEHGVVNTADYVDRPPALRLQGHVGRGCYLDGLFQLAHAVAACLGPVFQHHVQGHGRNALVGALQHDTQLYEVVYHVGVGQGNEHLAQVGHLVGRSALGIHQGQLARGAVGEHRTDEAGEENEHHGTVEHRIVQQRRTVGQDDFVTDQGHGQRGGSA
ncbi:unknown [Prevotella sp. CAG:617]|nr:unknown [Prevotella sp. CAG:617]